MEPVAVVIDSREQLPYAFDPERIRAIRRALPAGDYSLDGFEDRVAVERKSLEDFVSTVIRRRERFVRELDRLGRMEVAGVVVEGDLTQVLRHDYAGGAHPSSVLGAAVSIIVDHHVPVFFAGNREGGRLFVERLLLRAHRRLARG